MKIWGNKDKLCLIFFISIFITFVLAFYLRQDFKFNFIATHSQPCCYKELGIFESSICEYCGETIENTGRFKENTPVGMWVKFTDVFDNYKDYKTTFMITKILSVIYLITGIVDIILIFRLIQLNYFRDIFDGLFSKKIKTEKSDKKR